MNRVIVYRIGRLLTLLAVAVSVGFAPALGDTPQWFFSAYDDPPSVDLGIVFMEYDGLAFRRKAGESTVGISREIADTTSKGQKELVLKLRPDKSSFILKVNASDGEPGSLNLDAEVRLDSPLIRALRQAEKLGVGDPGHEMFTVALAESDRDNFFATCDRLAKIQRAAP